MILGDSSFFIALADGNDRWHPNALKLRSRLRGDIVVSDLAVAEAITAIGARKGGRAASVLGDFFVDNCRIEFLDPKSLPEVSKVYLRYDGALSVSDAHAVWLMESLGIRDILSFDSDFDKVQRVNRIH